MGPVEEALGSRNEGLLPLRDLDEQLSHMYPADFGYAELMDERQRIVEALVVMNCEPWALGEEPWIR